MAVANDLGFLEKCIRRIPVLNFVSRTSGILYLRYEDGKGEVVDGPTLEQVMDDPACADTICRLTAATLPAATHI